MIQELDADVCMSYSGWFVKCSRKGSLETDEKEIETDDLEIFGFYIMNHPTSSLKGVVKIKDISKYKNRRVILGTIIDKIKVINTKKGEKMAFLNLSDDTGSIAGVIFPKNNTVIDLINESDIALFKATISDRNGELQAVIEEIKLR